MSKKLHHAAQIFLENGLSVFPTKKDKSPAVPSWKKFQKSPMPVDKIKDYFNGHGQMAVITGNGLEMIDIDDRHLFNDFQGYLLAEGLQNKVLLEKSPNGYHVVYKFEGESKGNLKLAMGWEEVDEAGEYEWNDRTTLKARDINGKWIVSPCLIETRGTGGYFLCAPSEGYHVIEGAWGSLKPLTSKERDLILEIGRRFDKRPTTAQTTESEPYDEDLKLKIRRPGDLFNEEWETTASQVLEEAGWIRVASTPKSTTWRRPGKKKGVSGELHNDGLFHCYSTSVPELETESKQYTAFSLLVALKFEGDYGAAAAWINENYEVFSTEEEVKKVLKDNPTEIDNAYNYSGLSEATVTELLLDLSLPVPPSHKVARTTVKYRPTQLNKCIKKIDQALCNGSGDWGYHHLMGSVGYIQCNQFHMYNKDSLELRIEQSVEIKVKKKKTWYTDRCPMHVVQKLLTYPGTKASRITGFSHTPMINKKGDIYGLEHGYEKGIYFTHNGGFEVADDLSWQDCYDKLEEELCGDILFVPEDTELLTAAYIGFMLSSICRPGFKGGCPGTLFTANEAGTGKSTAINIALSIITGEGVGSNTWMSTPDERAKALIAQIAAGGTTILHDNIQKGTELDDGNYAEAITAGKITGRRLGKTETMRLDCKMNFVFGGNSLTVSQELARRLTFIRLETQKINPAQRQVKDRDIVQNVIKNRKRYLGYLLRMLQLGANMKDQVEEIGGSGVGTFWDHLVRNPILVETGVDIANALGISSEGGSRDIDLKDQTIELLYDLYRGEGEDGFTARHLYNWVNSEEETTGELLTDVKDSLVELNGFAFKSTKSLGRALMMIVNRPSAAGVIIKAVRKGQRAITYEFVGMGAVEGSE